MNKKDKLGKYTDDEIRVTDRLARDHRKFLSEQMHKLGEDYAKVSCHHIL